MRILDDMNKMQEEFQKTPVKMGDAEFSMADFLVLAGTAIQLERINNGLTEAGAEAAHNVLTTLLWLVYTGDYKQFLKEYKEANDNGSSY